MRISDVRAYPLSAPIPVPVGSALGLPRERTACLVEVITDQGLSGWGEAGVGRAQQVLAAVVERQLRPLLLGEDPANVNRLWEKMYGSLIGSGRTAGTTIQAVSGVDIALWDLRGKAAGVPTHVLLGGKTRDSVLAYASGFYYSDGGDPFALVEEQARGYLDQGFRAAKMKIGGETLATDVRRIRAAREILGPDCQLSIDANQGYSVAAARELGLRVADCDLVWFEEPLPAHDLPGYKELKASIPIPLAAGECLYTRWAFRDWLAQRAVEIAQPDVCNAGGLTECVRIGAMASAWGILCNPHAWGTPVALAATLHLALTLPPLTHTRTQLPFVHAPALEYDRGANPLREELGPLPFTFQEGFVTPNGQPGLGLEIDRAALKRFAAD